MYFIIDEKKIYKNMWKNYGMTFIEYAFLNYFRKQSSHVVIKDKANLSKIVEKKNL